MSFSSQENVEAKFEIKDMDAQSIISEKSSAFEEQTPAYAENRKGRFNDNNFENIIIERKK